jgi:ATP-dependent protease ClpP protease subunit
MSVEVKGYIVPDDDQWIYDWFGIGTTAPQNIRQAIADANGAPLDVEISTCYGGDVFSGSTMYSALRGYSGGVRIHITGLAASAASVIAMAGLSDMSPTAQLMVHRVSSMAEGNYHAMDASSASLQEADKAIAAAYVAKAGMSEKDALKLMDAETWITAAHAVELGLVDKISEAAAPQLINAAYGLPLPRAVIEKTRAMLAEKKAGAGEKPESAAPPAADAQALAIARAKLGLIEKSLNF